LPEENKIVNFEETALQHLAAAYNLARWLTRNDADAEDVVQEAYLRAFKFFSGFHGGDSRAWILKIVRNTCWSWLQKNRSHEITTEFDEEMHETETSNPEMILITSVDSNYSMRFWRNYHSNFAKSSLCANWRVCHIKKLQASQIYRWEQ